MENFTPPTQAELDALKSKRATIRGRLDYLRRYKLAVVDQAVLELAVEAIDTLTKEVEELQKDLDWLGEQNILLEEVQDLFTEHDSFRETVRLTRTAMQKPLRASADERLVLGEPIKNHSGNMCGLCDATYEHSHPTLKCVFCGRSGLSKNMVGHECSAMQQKGEE